MTKKKIAGTKNVYELAQERLKLYLMNLIIYMCHSPEVKTAGYC